jgi:hypothetical protein
VKDAPVLPHDILESNDLRSHGEDQAGMVVDAVGHGISVKKCVSWNGKRSDAGLWLEIDTIVDN